MSTLVLKLKALGQILGHFRNPCLVLLMRLGLLKVPLFLYRLSSGNHHYAMLARPTSNSMADLFVLREVFLEEAYRDLLPLLPKGPLRVVDVGGNIGSFSVWLHLRHGIGEGYCFEPDPASHNLCRYNLGLNGCAGVQLFPKAAGGVRRRITLLSNATRPGSSSIYARSEDRGEDRVEVEVVDFAAWLGTVPGDFHVLKMDCEGAEWEILKHSAADVIRRFGIIIAEVHADPENVRRVEDFPTLLAERGFKTLRWDGHEQGLYVGQRTLQANLNPSSG